MVWSSGAEVQKKSLALVRKRFTLVRTALAPVRETFSALPLWSPKPPLALSPNHFGAIWAIWLLSVPTGVASLDCLVNADLFQREKPTSPIRDRLRTRSLWPPFARASGRGISGPNKLKA